MSDRGGAPVGHYKEVFMLHEELLRMKERAFWREREIEREMEEIGDMREGDKRWIRSFCIISVVFMVAFIGCYVVEYFTGESPLHFHDGAGAIVFLLPFSFWGGWISRMATEATGR